MSGARLFIGIAGKKAKEQYYLLGHKWRPESETWSLSYEREHKKKPNELIEHHVTLKNGKWSCSCEASHFNEKHCKHVLAIKAVREEGLLK